MSDNLERALGRVEGRMSGVEKQLASLTEALNKRHGDEDQRLSKVETKLARYSGGLAVLTFIVPAVAKAMGIL